MPQDAATTDHDYEALQQLILRAIEIIRSDDFDQYFNLFTDCLLYTSPSPRDVEESRMPSSA